MYADFKKTIWERVEIPDDKEEKFIQLLNENKIQTVNDVFEQLEEENLPTENIEDTEDYMSLEENDGCETIEVYRNEHSRVWDNKNLFDLN